MDLITYALLNKKKASLVNGKVPASQLPSYVDEVIEIAGKNSFPTEGDKSKIYIDTTTGSSYRWGGTSYFLTGASDLSDYYTKSEVDDKVAEATAGIKAVAHETEALFDPNLSSFKDGDVVYATELNHAFTIGANAFSNMDNLIPKLATFYTIYFAGNWYYNAGTNLKINDYMSFICLNGHASLNSAIEVTNGSFSAKNMDLGMLTVTGGSIELENCHVLGGITHTATSAYTNLDIKNCTIDSLITCQTKMNNVVIANSTLDNCPISLNKGATTVTIKNNRITPPASMSAITIKDSLTGISEITDNIIVGDASSIVELTGMDGSKFASKLKIMGNNLAFSRALLYLPATSTGLTSEQFDIRHNVIYLGSAAALIVDNNNLGLEISNENIMNIKSDIVVDQKFDGTSENAQSGKAIQAALDLKANADQVNSLLTNTKTNIGILSLRDMSPITHTLDIVTAPDVIIHKYGKNLLPYPYSLTNTTESGISFVIDDDGVINATGTAELDITCIVQSGTFPATGKYIFSGAPKVSKVDTYYMYITIDGEAQEQTEDPIQIIGTKGADYQVGIIIKQGQSMNNLQFKPQIEYGQCGGTYEQYKAPITYTADETGAVTTMQSEKGVITLVSPDEQLITVTYNRDLNRAIAEIQSILSFETL